MSETSTEDWRGSLDYWQYHLDMAEIKKQVCQKNIARIMSEHSDEVDLQELNEGITNVGIERED